MQILLLALAHPASRVQRLEWCSLLQPTPENRHVWQESWIRGRSDLLRSILLYLSRVADFRTKTGAELSQAKLVVSFEDTTAAQLVQERLHKPDDSPAALNMHAVQEEIRNRVFEDPAFVICFLPPQRNCLASLAEWRPILMGMKEFGAEKRCLDIYMVTPTASVACAH